ncbi:MAG TPA: transcription termination/antitermination NusG family protein [Vicinamibacterales bacterium]|nr:transcription termination/antitermination NusG family protein [Vicinamibacterales bacterium]
METSLRPFPSVHPREPRWYVVQTHPHQEQRAALNIASYGAECFLPMTRRSARGSRQMRAEPLFTRYLFVKCDIWSMAHKIVFVRGVAKVLGTSAGPTSVDESVIAEIRSRVGADGFVRVTPGLESGDRVVVTAGALRGIVAVFHSSTTADERVRLLLTAIDSSIRLVVDRDEVEPLPAAS